MPHDTKPLQGKTIIITKPLQQSQYLSQQIKVLGGTPVLLPSLAITPIADKQHLLATAANLRPKDIIIFISPNAVSHSMPLVQAHYKDWPQHQHWLAVGLSTAQKLHDYNVKAVLTPSYHYNTEGLLGLPLLQSVTGVRIIIMQGVGGRELLKDTLLARGAEVQCVACYHRVIPDGNLQNAIATWQLSKKAVLISTSGNGLENITQIVDKNRQTLWQQTPLIVSSARLADKARQLGFQGNIILAKSALDDDILKQMITWEI